MCRKLQIALIVGLVLLLAGCVGPMADEGSDDVSEILEQTQDGMDNVESYEAAEELSLDMDAGMMQMQLEQEADTVVDVENDEFYRTGVESGLIGGDMEFEEYYVDGKLYESEALYEDSWTVEETEYVPMTEFDDDELADELQDETFLELLEVESEGDSYVITGDFSGELDLLEELGSDEFSDIEEDLADPEDVSDEEIDIEEFHIEYIISQDDYLPESLSITIDVEMEDEGIDGSTEEFGFKIDADIEYTAYDEPVEIELPEEAEDADEVDDWGVDDGEDTTDDWDDTDTDDIWDSDSDSIDADVEFEETDTGVSVTVDDMDDSAEAVEIWVFESDSFDYEVVETVSDTGTTVELEKDEDYEEGASIEVMAIDEHGAEWFVDFYSSDHNY